MHTLPSGFFQMLATLSDPITLTIEKRHIHLEDFMVILMYLHGSAGDVP